MFGGWWADMNYFVLRAKPPAASWRTMLLGSEFERRTSKYAKSERHILNIGEQRVAINLGIMWAQQGSPLLMEAQRKAKALWQKKQTLEQRQVPGSPTYDPEGVRHV